MMIDDDYSGFNVEIFYGIHFRERKICGPKGENVGANKQIIEELIGDDSMYQALMEIMKPVIQLCNQENIEKGLKRD